MPAGGAPPQPLRSPPQANHPAVVAGAAVAARGAVTGDLTDAVALADALLVL